MGAWRSPPSSEPGLIGRGRLGYTLKVPNPYQRSRRRARLLTRARAELFYLLRSLRSIGRPLTLLALVLGLGAALIRAYGQGEGGQPLDWSSAIFQSYGLLLSEHLDPRPGAHPVLQVLQYLWPILGFLLLAEGLIKLGITVFRKEENREAWVEILARASRGHVILCGVGNVGYRTLEELVRLGEQVIAVDRDANCPFLDRARALGASVYVGDARDEHVLRKLNVEKAAAVIIATNDDLANLEIAMDVREVRDDIHVVMRLFDQALARKVRGALGVDVSVSTSALAAPLFASAALDRSVVGTHRVGDALMVVAEQEVHAAGQLVGATVAGLLRDLKLSVLALRTGEGPWELQPAPDTRLRAGDRVQLLVHSAELHRMHALNSPRDGR